MTILVGVILTISFFGFQLPLIASAMSMRKIDTICKVTIQNARRLKGKGSIVSLTFYKSANQ